MNGKDEQEREGAIEYTSQEQLDIANAYISLTFEFLGSYYLNAKTAANTVLFCFAHIAKDMGLTKAATSYLANRAIELTYNEKEEEL